ncbi:DUF305 domain-containing protein [Goodfellowiella coeruleoviolacea]|uniref:Uncharacterized conserved protein, DUF305 family n=1 Tax=Goodfellowiella coeruleoviolacea TaxID=334858 RepID=A0AAE3GAM6_9PSEU|nr:DUF305 domain-containing protein [Goodfellowiella coeruleoviolacea]MCP2164761.1 Uncharacterized conserved protein, DUF305 family [Goodfellowiella coeruleoviolacea]
MTSRTLVGTALAVLASVAVLTACTNSETDSTTGHDMGAVTTTASQSGGTTASAEHNDADVRFAQQMIPHHAQAVAMADLVAGHTGNQRVLDLAQRIRQAQQPEIDTMTGWLSAWGVPAAASSSSGVDHSGMDHGSSSMPGMDHGSGMSGMMSEEQMDQLDQARDAEFDRQWLSMMVEHHQGAIDMANTELAQGVNPAAKQLAGQIVAAQQQEISELRGLLDQG